MRSIVTAMVCMGMVLFTGLTRADDVQPPLPVMQGVGAESDARFDQSTGSYTYLYTARNGAASSGNVGSLFLSGTALGDAQVPEGWISAARQNGTLMVSYAGTGPEKPPGQILAPGGSMQFSLTSKGPPIIAVLWLRADWIPEGEEQEDDATRALYARLDTQANVLGPGTATVGSYEHWSRFRADIQVAAGLGWISDAQFAQTVSTQLAAARRAFETQGDRQAVAPLQTLLATVDGSTPAQRNATAAELLVLNTQSLIAAMQAAPATAEAALGPALQLALKSPAIQTLPLGMPASFVGRLTDRANDDKPVAGYLVNIRVSAGPDMHSVVSGVTDADGRFSLSLQGKGQGKDMVTVGDAPANAMVQVIWKGGPDLTMRWFIPPMLRWRGFGPVLMTDTVENVGDGPAGPSTVRYYLSATRPVDPKTARMVGSRQVRALAPDETDDGNQVPIQFPADLPPGIYYMAACANADHQVVEIDETNNCIGYGESGIRMIMMAAPAARTHP